MDLLTPFQWFPRSEINNVPSCMDEFAKKLEKTFPLVIALVVTKRGDKVKAILDGTDGHLCYKIVPHMYVLFDELNFPENPRQEFIVNK